MSSLYNIGANLLGIKLSKTIMNFRKSQTKNVSFHHSSAIRINAIKITLYTPKNGQIENFNPSSFSKLSHAETKHIVL